MSERRILVIGSQCQALSQLGFLPQAAQELYRVMIDPERGACVSALEGEGLLIDPTVRDTKDAIKKAYRRAAKDEATLFIAYIGHGERADEDFYLLPQDAENPPDSDTAVHLTNIIKEAHKKAVGQVDGLAVLVDACYSGQAGFGAAQSWVRGLGGTLRFEVLTAAADRPAADGCFSRSLVALLRDGVATEPSEHLHCVNLRPLIKKHCPNQEAQNPAYNPDATLWLAKNAASIREPWAQTPLADEIQRLTLAYQPTLALDEIVTRSRAERCVAVVGDAGTGKSALAAALAWPKAAQGAVPAGFVHAIALLNEATTPRELARTLTEQLVRSVPGFREAQQAFMRDTPYDEQQKLDTLEKQLLGPLTWLGRLEQPSQVTAVRIVVDALDRLATGARSSVMETLNQLGKLAFVRLLVTARPDTELPPGASSYSLAFAPDEKIHQYLERRGTPPARQGEVVQAAEGSWLVARVLADLLGEQPKAPIGAGGLALGDAYEEMLSRCGAADDESLRRVLEILAAAGAGPLLPLPLLCKTSEALGGPASPVFVRDQLVRLRGLAVRSAAGTENEHAGLFHQTLVDYVAARAPQEIIAAHKALIVGIEALAPPGAGPTDLNNAIQRYAFEREAEHLWTLGEADSAWASLSARTSPIPRDNLRRWRLWLMRVEAVVGSDHPVTFIVRNNIAHLTGECGDPRESLRLFEALLPDQERVLGPDHPDTLMTRSNIAYSTSMCGNVRQALCLAEALLPDQERVSGPDYPGTLTIRNNIAHWTGDCGNPREALRLFQELLPNQERILGADHPDTLKTRSNIALWTGNSGDAREALRLAEALLTDEARVLGLGHPNTLTLRNNIAHWTGDCGNPREALRLFQELLPDQERILGADHPDTLKTRSNIALWTGNSGDTHEALRLAEALLNDEERVLGLDHPNTLTIRSNIALWTGECGDSHEALRLFEALLPDQERILGANHPDTLKTRSNMAYSISLCGDAREGLRLTEALLPDLERVLGSDHPLTLATRNNIALWTGECGDSHEALRLFEALLVDQERIVGPDHPDTLKIRGNVAHLIARNGDAREALRLLQLLLADHERVLGPNHPALLIIRINIAYLTAECGDAREALRLFQALLPDQERILGPDHPNTLIIKESIDHLTAS
ncbi:tetratricopeptide repeat protein [Nitrosospira sp. Nsp5]|uniref:Tetratricopeptide repeat-containing protein n=1 Tax=Nitrosospira multiformis TaxID=1231 RepID=A0ABY0TJY5_9PROT|nr:MULTISPECIES: tetratricopeptide repeat protein [Nitrosospira]PTR09165.1 tetratricopeptide repeat protein [Nitrosospira sp. Nsp5]SDQ72413.1 Tetratricopeptide repeat-containing protein [Nitrosospira multiformis]